MSFFGEEFFGSGYFQAYAHEETYLGTGFFGGDFFGDGFFYEGVDEAVKTGGKGDNPPKRSIYKPTGLPPYRTPPRKTVEHRVKETRQIAAEVVREAGSTPVAHMSLSDIESEIGELIRQKLRTEDEEMMLLLLAASVT